MHLSVPCKHDFGNPDVDFSHNSVNSRCICIVAQCQSETLGVILEHTCTQILKPMETSCSQCNTDPHSYFLRNFLPFLLYHLGISYVFQFQTYGCLCSTSSVADLFPQTMGFS